MDNINDNLYNQYFDKDQRLIELGNNDLTKQILFGIFEDMLDRDGISNVLDECDTNIKNEMLKKWYDIIKYILDAYMYN